MSSKSKTPIYYVPPKPSPRPDDYDEFMASINEKEKILFEIAQEKLGSSFFVQWTHLYKKWKASKK